MFLELNPVNEPLPTKTPVDMRPIESVKIKFKDGTTRDIFLRDIVEDEGYYKQEELKSPSVTLMEHSIYIVNGVIRDSPAFGLD